MAELLSDDKGLYSQNMVFNAVVDGMDLVKQIEALGSGSGSTSKKITIADSGELPVTSSEF